MLSDVNAQLYETQAAAYTNKKRYHFCSCDSIYVDEYNLHPAIRSERHQVTQLRSVFALRSMKSVLGQYGHPDSRLFLILYASKAHKVSAMLSRYVCITCTVRSCRHYSLFDISTTVKIRTTVRLNCIDRASEVRSRCSRGASEVRPPASLVVHKLWTSF